LVDCVAVVSLVVGFAVVVGAVEFAVVATFNVPPECPE